MGIFLKCAAAFDLNLNILDFLGHEDGDKLDQWCEYNIKTMGSH